MFLCSCIKFFAQEHKISSSISCFQIGDLRRSETRPGGPRAEPDIKPDLLASLPRALYLRVATITLYEPRDLRGLAGAGGGFATRMDAGSSARLGARLYDYALT